MTEKENPKGFTSALKDACEKRCNGYGDPACWRLPDLVEPCEVITPCAECLSEIEAHEEAKEARG